MDTMDHAEFAELLAVYSLDALPPEEASVLEGHLAECPRCRAELEALRDVAALLGNSGVSAPAGTWDRIANELGTSASDHVAPLLAFQSRKRTPAWRNAAIAVAAVVLAVLGLLSYRMVNLDHRVGQLQDALGQHGVGQMVALALADPAHQSIELSAKASSGRAQVVVLPDGTAYWVNDDLGGLPTGKTYQLWALASGKVVSIGILGRAPRDVPFRVEPTMTELMVTAEPAGGVPAPTTPVLVQGALAV